MSRRRKATIRKPPPLGRGKVAKAELPPIPDTYVLKPLLAACHFCQRQVEEREFRCMGCGEVVCDRCDELAPWGPHAVFEHLPGGRDEEDS